MEKVTLQEAQETISRKGFINCKYKGFSGLVSDAKLRAVENKHEAYFRVFCDNGFITDVTLSEAGHHRVLKR